MMTLTGGDCRVPRSAPSQGSGSDPSFHSSSEGSQSVKKKTVDPGYSRQVAKKNARTSCMFDVKGINPLPPPRQGTHEEGCLSITTYL